MRVTRTPSGALRLGPGPGRGAWLHPDGACVDLAVRRRAFGRALRAEVSEGAVVDLRVAMGV